MFQAWTRSTPESSRFRLNGSKSSRKVRPTSLSNDGVHVLLRQGLLIHAELDRLDRIGRVHGIVRRLIAIDQRRQDIQAITVWGSALRAP